MDTCADCAEIINCQLIGNWYNKKGMKYKKYEDAICFIREHGYLEFVSQAENWTNAYGEYK